MSDYPMLISNKLHSFRNFPLQKHRGGLYGSFLHFIRYFTSLFPLPCPVALWEVALAI